VRCLEPFIERGDLGIKSGRGFYTWPEAEFLDPAFKEAEGFREDLYERMFGALAGVALALVGDGIAEAREVDRAWRIVQRQPVGPLGLVDRFGFDETLLLVRELLAEPGVRSAELERGCDLLEDLLARGRRGVSSGEGFYTYPDPEYQREGFLEGDLDRREG
jgi:3-hydroxybutyryl-CoA dehydrogenase